MRMSRNSSTGCPDILENEKLQQINRDQHKNEEDLAELTKMMEEPESDE